MALAHGLVETAFVTRPTPSPPWMRPRRTARAGGRHWHDRQTGGHVHIVAAVLPDSALGPSPDRRQKMGLYLHHDALRGAEGHRLGVRPVSSNRAAPAAPSAAQVPVV